MFVFFLILSLAAAAVYSAAAGFVIWKALLVLILSFLAWNILYLLFFWIVSLFIDDAKPRVRQNPVCRFGCDTGPELICRYMGIRPQLTGEELLPEGRFLMVCNHRSGFDPIMAMYTLRGHNVSFISKPSNMRIPIVGKTVYGAGFLSINRDNDREALKTILTAADYLKRDVCSVAIYPEGTRSRTGELLPFHAGSFKIAQKAGVPLVIAATRGGEKVKKNFPLRRTDMYLDILEVLPAERVKAESTQELARYSWDVIARKLEADT